MSVVIRLSRTGKTHAISYRIVATEKWSKRDGSNIEILGFYNPWQREGDRYKVDQARYDYWVSKGAKPSPAVEELVETKGNPKPKPKKERPKKEVATATAPAPAATEAPVVDSAKTETATAEPATPVEPAAEAASVEPVVDAAPAAEPTKEEVKTEEPKAEEPK